MKALSLGQSILFAALLHGLVLFILDSREIRSTQPVWEPLELMFVPRKIEPATSALPPTPEPRSSGVAAKKSIVSEGGPEEKPKPLSESKDYSSLLPRLSDLTTVDSAQKGFEGNTAQKSELAAQAAFAADHIDIPLITRTAEIEGMAVARLKFDTETHSIQLASLTGMTILRAVLYEFVLQPETRSFLKKVFLTLEESEFRIFLHIAPNHGLARKDYHAWKSSSLHIYRFARGSKRKSISLSLTLPDAEAEKAENWDRQKELNLKNLKAYSSIIENETLCTNC